MCFIISSIFWGMFVGEIINIYGFGEEIHLF